MRECRSKIYNGTPIPECETCYQLEAKGGHSDRKTSIEDYGSSAKTIQNIADSDFKVSAPEVLDLRVGNVCNLKCQSCFSNLSIGVYDDIQQAFGNDDDLRPSPNHPRKLEAGFTVDQLEEVLSGVKEIKIIGGEPTLSQDWKVLSRYLVEQGFSKNIKVITHTNLTNFDESFFSDLMKFKHASVGLSIDGFSRLNDYLRYPSRWDSIIENLNRVATFFEGSDSIDCRINTVIQISNFYQLSDLGEFLLRETNTSEWAEWNAISLTDPSYYDVHILPTELIQKGFENFMRWRATLAENEKRWTNEIYSTLSGLSGGNSNEEELKRYIRATEIYDKFRGHDINELSTILRDVKGFVFN